MLWSQPPTDYFILSLPCKGHHSLSTGFFLTLGVRKASVINLSLLSSSRMAECGVYPALLSHLYMYVLTTIPSLPVIQKR